MSADRSTNDAPRGLLARIGSRAISASLWPLGGAERVVVAVIDSQRLRDAATDVVENERVREAAKAAIESDVAKQVVATFFESGLFDEFVDRLLASPALWRLVDEIAASPAVTAAITQQSLGFADQVEEEVRMRSRGADDWLEQKVRRLVHRRQRPASAAGESPNGAGPSPTLPAGVAPSGEGPERDAG